MSYCEYRILRLRSIFFWVSNEQMKIFFLVLCAKKTTSNTFASCLDSSRWQRKPIKYHWNTFSPNAGRDKSPQMSTEGPRSAGTWPLRKPWSTTKILAYILHINNPRLHNIILCLPFHCAFNFKRSPVIFNYDPYRGSRFVFKETKNMCYLTRFVWSACVHVC